jgi:hypothetical protein
VPLMATSHPAVTKRVCRATANAVTKTTGAVSSGAPTTPQRPTPRNRSTFDANRIPTSSPAR